MPVRVGVIGTGNIGSAHVRRLAGQIAGTTVSAVFDVAAERARTVADAVGARAHHQATDVIDDPAVDAVLIASPADTHAELALACLAAGKPVLCEKPLASTAAAALKVLRAEAALGRRVIQVGFMRRYDKGYVAMKAAIDGGSIGVPLLAHCVHRNASVPPGFTTEMAMTDSVVHEIDVVRWLLGQEFVSARALTGLASPLAPTGVRDPQLAVLETSSGVLVEVESFVNCQYGYDVRCEIVGSTGTVSLVDPTATTMHSARQRTQEIAPDWGTRFEAAYIAELQQWADGVAGGIVCGPSAWDGYAAAAVAESCVTALSSDDPVQVALVDRPALY